MNQYLRVKSRRCHWPLTWIESSPRSDHVRFQGEVHDRAFEVNEKDLSHNERDALVRLIQTALDTKSIPDEDRALVVRAKKKLEAMDLKKKYPPPQARPLRAQKWE